MTHGHELRGEGRLAGGSGILGDGGKGGQFGTPVKAQSLKYIFLKVFIISYLRYNNC